MKKYKLTVEDAEKSLVAMKAIFQETIQQLESEIRVAKNREYLFVVTSVDFLTDCNRKYLTSLIDDAKTNAEAEKMGFDLIADQKALNKRVTEYRELFDRMGVMY